MPYIIIFIGSQSLFVTFIFDFLRKNANLRPKILKTLFFQINYTGFLNIETLTSADAIFFKFFYFLFLFFYFYFLFFFNFYSEFNADSESVSLSVTTLIFKDINAFIKGQEILFKTVFGQYLWQNLVNFFLDTSR